LIGELKDLHLLLLKKSIDLFQLRIQGTLEDSIRVGNLSAQ
jgi:hypothetical protein